jgi:hypothetical protein
VAPANDNFASSTSVGALPFTDSRGMSDATLEAGEPQPGCGTAITKSMWYSFTPATTVTLHADAFTSLMDGHAFAVAVYTGNSLPSLVRVACNSSYPNAVDFTALAGVTYHFQVGPWPNGSGSGVVRFDLLAPPPPPSNDPACTGPEVFADNFDSDALGLDRTSTTNWQAAAGTFDVIGPGLFDEYPGNGHYIDLDGGQGGVPADPFVMKTSPVSGFTVGEVFCLQFDLAGSTRADGLNVVTVSFGSYNEVFALPSDQGFTRITRQVTANAGDKLAFHNGGRDWEGAKLDRVRMTTPFAPAAYEGRAYAVGLTPPGGPATTFVDTGFVMTHTSTDQHVSLASVAPNPKLTASLLDARVTLGGFHASASASIAEGRVMGISFRNVRATSDTVCSSSIGGSTSIEYLQVGTVLLLNVSPAPNLRIPLDGAGTLVLNEQIPLPGLGMRVNAVHLIGGPDLDVVIASAETTIRNCPA